MKSPHQHQQQQQKFKLDKSYRISLNKQEIVSSKMTMTTTMKKKKVMEAITSQSDLTRLPGNNNVNNCNNKKCNSRCNTDKDNKSHHQYNDFATTRLFSSSKINNSGDDVHRRHYYHEGNCNHSTSRHDDRAVYLKTEEDGNINCDDYGNNQHTQYNENNGSCCHTRNNNFSEAIVAATTINSTVPHSSTHTASKTPLILYNNDHNYDDDGHQPTRIKCEFNTNRNDTMQILDCRNNRSTETNNQVSTDDDFNQNSMIQNTTISNKLITTTDIQQLSSNDNEDVTNNLNRRVSIDIIDQQQEQIRLLRERCDQLEKRNNAVVVLSKSLQNQDWERRWRHELCDEDDVKCTRNNSFQTALLEKKISEKDDELKSLQSMYRIATKKIHQLKKLCEDRAVDKRTQLNATECKYQEGKEKMEGKLIVLQSKYDSAISESKEWEERYHLEIIENDILSKRLDNSLRTIQAMKEENHQRHCQE